MRNTLVAAAFVLLLIGCGGTASQPPQVSGILSATWGDSRDTVLAKFSAEGLELKQDSIDLTFSGGTYEGFAVDTWVLTFDASGKLTAGSVTFAPDTAGTAAFAEILQSRISAKYGEPSSPMTWGVSGEAGATTLQLSATDGNPVTLNIQASVTTTASEEPQTEAPKVE